MHVSTWRKTALAMPSSRMHPLHRYILCICVGVCLFLTLAYNLRKNPEARQVRQTPALPYNASSLLWWERQQATKSFGPCFGLGHRRMR